MIRLEDGTQSVVPAEKFGPPQMVIRPLQMDIRPLQMDIGHHGMMASIEMQICRVWGSRV